MQTLSIEISSLFPIDLTACVYYNFAVSKIGTRILLNAELATSVGAQTATGVARGSFPLYECEYNGPTDWQIAHTTTRDGASHVDQLLHSLNALKEKSSGCSEGVQKRIDLLISSNSGPTKTLNSGAVSWSTLTSAIIKHVFASYDLLAPHFEDISQARQAGALSASQRQSLKTLFARAPVSPTRLTDAGCIELQDRATRRWARADTIRKDGKHVLLTSSNGRYVSPPIHLDDFDSIPLRIRGGLELRIVGGAGYCVPDLPWYFTNFDFALSDECAGIEVISPISIKSARRSTQRLKPSGYVITDYAADDSRRFATAIMGADVSSRYFSEDLSLLVDKPPQTNARLSKSQSAIKSLVASVIDEAKQQIAKANYRPTPQIVADIESPDPFSLGRKLTAFAVVLTLSKPSGWKDQAVSGPSNELLEHLCRPSLLSAPELLSWLARTTVPLMRMMRARNTMPVYDAASARLAVLANGFYSIRPADQDWGVFVSQLVQWSHDNATAYYAWFAAQVTGNLKAHLLLLHALLDSEQLSDSIRAIALKRASSGPTVLPYSAKYWDSP